jgi:Domain of unknown function (DUF4278)
MVQLSERPQVQSVQPPTFVEPTRKLTYRGMTYEVPQYSLPTRTPAEIEQLIGKRLSYRGTTYEIAASSMHATSESQVTRQLRYRGTTYSSYPKSHLSALEYVAV